MTSFDFNWKSNNKTPKGAIFAKKRKPSQGNREVTQKQPKSMLSKSVDLNQKIPKKGKKHKLDSTGSSNILEKKSETTGNERKQLKNTFQKAVKKDNPIKKVKDYHLNADETNLSIQEVNQSTENEVSNNFSKPFSKQGSSNQPQTFIKRKWKKDKIAAKKAYAEGKTNQNEPKKHLTHSLFAVGQKDIYVKSNTRAKSVVEEVFSADKKFSDLDIHKYIISNLEKINFTTVTTVQEKSIPIILKGDNVLIRSQTGSGKTLAYAIPILDALQKINPRIQRGDGVQAIIIVPTRELALQSHELFGKINTFQWIVTGHLCGGENRNTEKTRLRKGVHILIATPGRLLDHMLHTNAFKTQNVRCLVLDEADRLLDMGFKRDIVRIVEELDNTKKNEEYNPMALLKKTHFTDDDDNNETAITDSPKATDTDLMPLKDPNSKTRQTILLSATLTHGIAELADFTMKEHTYVDALEEFGEANPDMMVIPKTVQQKFIVTHVKHRLFTLSALLISQVKANSKVFVFMGTSSMVDYHYELFTRFLVRLPKNRGKLKRDNITILEDMEDDSDDDEEIVANMEFFKLHGNMDQSARKNVFTKFRAAEKGVLICTDVVARGIDVPAADCIIQYNGPQSIEDYLHRVGRTGRAGQSGTSYMFLTHEEQDFVTEMEKHRVYLQKQETVQFLENLSVVMDQEDHERAAIALQKRFENALENDKELHRSACVAYCSWSRFYNTYSNKMRPIFDFKKANLGHYVASFALKETPTVVAKIVKGQFVKKEARRLNQKLQIHIDEGKPRPKNPNKKKIKSLSLTTSEFSSGLEPVKKKRKKNKDYDSDN